MITIYPAYYDSFHCIADKCTDTCCAGWEIDIDDASYEAYMKVGGKLGDELKRSIKEYDDLYENHGFILTDDMRCPFLDNNNLCRLYKELGEASLCEVCTNTPRTFLEYLMSDSDDSINSIREISISASCPEASRLIYEAKEGIDFTVSHDNATSDITDNMTDSEIHNEAYLGAFLYNVRADAISILKDRHKPLSERLIMYLYHAERVQATIDAWETSDKPLPKHISLDIDTDNKLINSDNNSDNNDDTSNYIYNHFLIRMGTYTGLASIGRSWSDSINLIYNTFIKDDKTSDKNDAYKYINIIHKFMGYMGDNNRLYEYENLCVYYTFLLTGRAIDDYNYLDKAKTVILSFLMNRDMDLSLYVSHGDTFTHIDRQNNARIYARELEHADENLADMSEEILFERAYDTENLVRVV